MSRGKRKRNTYSNIPPRFTLPIQFQAQTPRLREDFLLGLSVAGLVLGVSCVDLSSIGLPALPPGLQGYLGSLCRAFSRISHMTLYWGVLRGTLLPLLIIICCCSVVKSCLILCDPMDCSTPGFPVLHCLPNLLRFMSIQLVMLSNHLILCHPLLLLPLVFPSIRVFPNESVLHIRWPRYRSFSFSFIISPSNEYSGLISFRIDWFDLLVV